LEVNPEFAGIPPWNHHPYSDDFIF
jgi:hypothetical protein